MLLRTRSDQAGTFGVRQECKQPVSKARMDAMPWTRLCRECPWHQQNWLWTPNGNWQ